jgi:hypothetical protein
MPHGSLQGEIVVQSDFWNDAIRDRHSLKNNPLVLPLPRRIETGSLSAPFDPLFIFGCL